MGGSQEALAGSGKPEYIIEFVNLKELLYGKNTSPVQGEEQREAQDNVFGNKEVKSMLNQVEKILGRGLSSTEIGRILSWLTDSGASPEVVVRACRYCMEKNKTS